MLTLIFGAGASFGSEVEGIPRPPLGDYLFEELEKQNGAFSKLPEEIKHEFRVNGFEKGMLAVPNDSYIINPLQNELAIYLSSFQASENNSYVKLFKMLGRLVEEVNLITLNYDLLIEQSLAITGVKMVRYGLHKGELSLLKVHGSSNFVPDMRGLNIGSIRAVNCGSFVRTQSMSALNSHEEIVRWCTGPNTHSLSPIMCMYNKEKRAVTNSDAVDSLKADFSRAVNESKAIFIVGVKYVPHDHHIWDEIFSSKSEVIIVDPKSDEQLIGELARNKIKATILNKPFNDCVVRLSGLIRSKFRV